MNDPKLILVELTQEEVNDFVTRRRELLIKKSCLNKIPISMNSIDIDEWRIAFSIAEPYIDQIMNLFYFYEDDKDIMRVN